MGVTGLPIVVATSNSFDDDLIEIEVLSKTNASVYRGSLDNVRERFYQCALENKFDVIVRVTGDNPFSEPSFVSKALEKIDAGAHYVRAKPTLFLFWLCKSSGTHLLYLLNRTVKNFRWPWVFSRNDERDVRTSACDCRGV